MIKCLCDKIKWGDWRRHRDTTLGYRWPSANTSEGRSSALNYRWPWVTGTMDKGGTAVVNILDFAGLMVSFPTIQLLLFYCKNIHRQHINRLCSNKPLFLKTSSTADFCPYVSLPTPELQNNPWFPNGNNSIQRKRLRLKSSRCLLLPSQGPHCPLTWLTQCSLRSGN